MGGGEKTKGGGIEGSSEKFLSGSWAMTSTWVERTVNKKKAYSTLLEEAKSECELGMHGSLSVFCGSRLRIMLSGVFYFQGGRRGRCVLEGGRRGGLDKTVPES